MKWANWIVSIISFFLGIFFVLMYMSFIKGDFGSVADWVSGIGSVLAIVAVYQQIKQSDKQYHLNNQANMAIALGRRNIIEVDHNEGRTRSDKLELYFWGVNDGQIADSFRFLGICTQEEFEIIEDKKSKDLNAYSQGINQYIIDPDNSIQSGFVEREFELINPRCKTETVSVSFEVIKDKWKNNGKLCVVYMNIMGDLYRSNFDMLN